MITFSLGDMPASAHAVAHALPCEGDAARLAAMDLTAFIVNRDGEPCGTLIVGTVADGWGCDLVVYAAVGEGGGLTEVMDRFTAELADAAGLDGVRCFTHRPGLVRRLARMGWEETARMMRREV